MVNLIDYILDLFRDENQAQAFVSNPDQALSDAGLSGVTSAQLQSVAAVAVPSLGLAGGGDVVAGLQQAVSSHYGFDPSFISQPSWMPQTGLSAGADFASNNSFLSPTTNIQDNQSLSFGLGDITLGDKTSAQGNGAVAIGGANHGDIVSGDGAVLGNGNTVNNGNIHAASGSTVAVGDSNAIHEGNSTSVDDSTHLTHTSATDNSVHDSSVHSPSVVDNSVHGSSVVDGSVHAGSVGDSSVHDNSVVQNSVHDNTVHDNTVSDNTVSDSSVHDSSVHDSSVHDNAVHDNAVHDGSVHDTTHLGAGLDAHLGF